MTLESLFTMYRIEPGHDYLRARKDATGMLAEVDHLGVYEEMLVQMRKLAPDFEFTEIRRNPDNDFVRVDVRRKAS